MTDERINELIAIGAVIKAGTTKLGEDVLVVTEKCKELEPKLYIWKTDYLGSVAMELWILDMLDVFIAENTWSVHLLPAAFDAHLVADLSMELQEGLEQLKIIFGGSDE